MTNTIKTCIATATIFDKVYTFIATGSFMSFRVKAFSVESNDVATVTDFSWGFNRRGVAAMKAFKDLTGIDQDADFFDNLTWHPIYK